MDAGMPYPVGHLCAAAHEASDVKWGREFEQVHHGEEFCTVQLAKMSSSPVKKRRAISHHGNCRSWHLERSGSFLKRTVAAALSEGIAPRPNPRLFDVLAVLAYQHWPVSSLFTRKLC